MDCEQCQKKNDVLLETLKQVNYQNEMLLAWVKGAVITVDREGNVTEANQAAADALGWSLEELMGCHLHSAIHHSQEDGSEYPWDFCPVFAAIEDGSSHHVDGDVFWQKSGPSFSADFITCPTRNDDNEITGAVLIFRNLSEQRLFEANRIHSLKLESIGELAAGIAHEINTPMQFIGSNVTFLQECFQDLHRLMNSYSTMKAALASHPQAEDILAAIEAKEQEVDLDYLLDEAPKAFEQTIDGISRVTKLILGLKGFAHSGEGESKRPSDVNEIIQNALVVCRNAYKYVANLETEFGELPIVNVHPSDIGQVIVNLVVNAAQAIADCKEQTNEMGTISIRTAFRDNKVVIEVADTGGGIPESVQRRVFDPFFTTKNFGKGSGQGLAISRTIIHNKHQGELRLESTVGKGTTFFVLLPHQTN